MPNPMTGIISHASTHTYAYCISISKSWDHDAPRRLLNTYAKQFDKRMKTWSNLLAAPSSTQRSKLCFFLLLHLLILLLRLLLHLKFKLVNL